MGTTPTYSWPYPEPTDPVANGAQDIEDLALAVESTVSGLGVHFAKALRNTDLTLTSTGASVFDSNLNLTVDAAAGDVISYTFDTYIAAGTNICHFMPYTLDAGGAIVNPVADMGTVFNPAIWQTAESSAKSFTFLYEVVAGDIVSNQVTVGLTVKTAGVSRQIVYATIGMRCYLTNLGPEVS